MLCMVVYERGRVVPKAVTLPCQFLRGHDGDHSWQAIRDEDEGKASPHDMVIEDFLDAIDHGEFDCWLEAILAVAHDRKRTLRGACGFPRYRPRR